MLRTAIFLSALLTARASAADLARGQILDDVKCEKDASQSYALYLPSNYTPDRAWPVLLAFDARANGKAPVTTYQAAAERYGYIVAGSKNSRNGPYSIGIEAAHSMFADVTTRFHTDLKRIYITGHSGGSRLAMGLALQKDKRYAGVIASSAAFPFPNPPDKLDFPVFGTAGTEDFNYIEMQQFDRLMKSPHRVCVFTGGHTWPTSELAVEAIEWLELQAMRSGLEPRNEKAIDAFLAAAKKRAAAATGVEAMQLWSGIATDFDGWRDVSEARNQAQKLSGSSAVKVELEKRREDEQYESMVTAELNGLLEDMSGPDDFAPVRERIKTRLTDLQKRATMPSDSSERRLARRVIRGFLLGARDVQDGDLEKFLATLR